MLESLLTFQRSNFFIYFLKLLFLFILRNRDNKKKSSLKKNRLNPRRRLAKKRKLALDLQEAVPSGIQVFNPSSYRDIQRHRLPKGNLSRVADFNQLSPTTSKTIKYLRTPDKDNNSDEDILDLNHSFISESGIVGDVSQELLWGQQVSLPKLRPRIRLVIAKPATSRRLDLKKNIFYWP